VSDPLPIPTPLSSVYFLLMLNSMLIAWLVVTTSPASLALATSGITFLPEVDTSALPGLPAMVKALQHVAVLLESTLDLKPSTFVLHQPLTLHSLALSALMLKSTLTAKSAVKLTLVSLAQLMSGIMSLPREDT
jgi:hypothetical protein